MDKSKLLFLFLIFLLVLVVSASHSEGFKAKKRPAPKPAAPAPAPGAAAPAQAKKSGKKKRAKKRKPLIKRIAKAIKKTASSSKANDEMIKQAKQAVSEAKKYSDNAAASLKQMTEDTQKNAVNVNKQTEIANNVKRIESIEQNVIAAETKIAESSKNISKISEDAINKVGSIGKDAQQVINVVNEIKTKIAEAQKLATDAEASTNKATNAIVGHMKTVETAVGANKQINDSIESKVKNMNAFVESSKKSADRSEQAKLDVETKLNDLDAKIKLILSQLELGVDKSKSSTLGFRNITEKNDDDNDIFKATNNLGFTSIESAYDGSLTLEGFGTTYTDSKYLNPASKFELEKKLVEALTTFNTAYYDYQLCLHLKKRTSSVSCAEKLATLTVAKTALSAAISDLNASITTMGALPASGTTGVNDTTGKITEADFQSRHDEIKALSANIRKIRSDLDSKMAFLLDKTKGPLPETFAKYDTTTYATVGLSILATSAIYYVFVEMK